jgi:hypothetical protein
MKHEVVSTSVATVFAAGDSAIENQTTMNTRDTGQPAERAENHLNSFASEVMHRKWQKNAARVEQARQGRTRTSRVGLDGGELAAQGGGARARLVRILRDGTNKLRLSEARETKLRSIRARAFKLSELLTARRVRPAVCRLLSSAAHTQHIIGPRRHSSQTGKLQTAASLEGSSTTTRTNGLGGTWRATRSTS